MRSPTAFIAGCFALSLVTTAYAVSPEELERKNRLKVSNAHDTRAKLRERKLHETNRRLRERGITLHEDYEHLRRLVDIESDLHDRELRRLTKKLQEDKEARHLEKKVPELKEELTKEDMAFWERLLQMKGDDSMSLPLVVPTTAPSVTPTPVPTAVPTVAPTAAPSLAPVPGATPVPTGSPTAAPSLAPVPGATPVPTEVPTVAPTAAPSLAPAPGATPVPTGSPTAAPSLAPAPGATPVPTGSPTSSPTPAPSLAPAPGATPVPTGSPTSSPTPAPSLAPVPDATPVPTGSPTSSPTAAPSLAPAPGATPVPTGSPTSAPSLAPVPAATPVPTGSPTASPTPAPTLAPVPDATPVPTARPSLRPTPLPTPRPTLAPTPLTVTPNPTRIPTRFPTRSPTPVPTAAPLSRVAQVILPVALFDGNEFVDPTSYQSKAFAWLEGSNVDGVSDDRIVQRYALACIFCATNNVSTAFTDVALGPGIVVPWNRQDNWLTNVNECDWENISCNGAGFVNVIDVFANFVTGEFPPEVVYLKGTLEILDLGRNLVFARGEIINSYIGELTTLRDLRYEETNFINSNGVPTEIGLLKNLEIYVCSNVRYVGALNGAAFPADMTQLTQLDIEFNSYNSTIPLAIGNLPNLQFFYARNAFIEGDLEFMRNMQSIIECWTDTNPGLGGTLPTFLGTLSTLASFSVTESGWTGQLPAELANPPAMLQMFLFDNAFTSTIPAAWGNFDVIARLEMELNDLVGNIPTLLCVKRLSSLTTLSADCVNCPTDLSFACCSSCFDEFGNEIIL